MQGRITLLDSHGQPLKMPSHSENRAAKNFVVNARYENAMTEPENARQWWNTDYFSAKAANSYAVRRQLRLRSRYELANNPFLFGIANSNATDVVDTGPTLKLLTSSEKYNRKVETAWIEWCDEVGFMEKLQTLKLARTVDGEGFLILKTVDDLENPVKLYPVDVEADQVTCPAPTDPALWQTDGVALHPITGQPKSYSVLKYNPGDFYFGKDFNPLKFEVVPARNVVHWFPKFRPGQVRGVPIFTPSLDLFSDLRSFRKSVMANARLVANHTVLLTSTAPAAGIDEDSGDEYIPFEKVPINNGMQTMLPAGMDGKTLDPKQPATTYEMFQSTCLGEACRPLAYPLNLALGSSQKFNFSSAKLDHLNYRHSITTERAECAAAALNKIFRAWYEEATLSGVIPFYDGMKVPPREWHWPGFEPLEAVADAQADGIRLANGTLTWREFWGKRGYDWRDVSAWQAEERDEHERLRLVFGDPLKRTETESTSIDESDDADPDFEDRGSDRTKAGAAYV